MKYSNLDAEVFSWGTYCASSYNMGLSQGEIPSKQNDLSEKNYNG